MWCRMRSIRLFDFTPLRGYTSSVSPFGLPPSPPGEGFAATPLWCNVTNMSLRGAQRRGNLLVQRIDTLQPVRNAETHSREIPTGLNGPRNDKILRILFLRAIFWYNAAEMPYLLPGRRLWCSHGDAAEHIPKNIPKSLLLHPIGSYHGDLPQHLLPHRHRHGADTLPFAHRSCDVFL